MVENEGIENEIGIISSFFEFVALATDYILSTSDMQGLLPHRCESAIDFDPAPSPDAPDLHHPNEPPYELDDIKVEYHPHSKKPPSVHHFSEFSRSRPSEGQIPRNNSPWEPFRTRLDFEVAEIALEAALTKEQTNRLLDLVHRSASGTDPFTLQSHDEVRSLWEMASQRYTPVIVFMLCISQG